VSDTLDRPGASTASQSTGLPRKSVVKQLLAGTVLAPVGQNGAADHDLRWINFDGPHAERALRGPSSRRRGGNLGEEFTFRTRVVAFSDRDLDLTPRPGTHRTALLMPPSTSSTLPVT
jgi:hypothetical protein